jgi:sigma-B regulation protein RsbU (phosphoserine phosphatase)
LQLSIAYDTLVKNLQSIPDLIDMIKIRLIAFYVALFIIALAISSYLYPDSHSFGALNFSVDKSVIIEKARKLAATYGLGTQGYHIDVKMYSNDKLIKVVHKNEGLAAGNKLLRNSIAGYWWDIRWNNLNGDIIFNGTSNQSQKNSNAIESNVPTDLFQLKYDLQGNLIHFSINLPDSNISRTGTMREAKDTAYEFIRTYSNLQDVGDDRMINHKISLEPDLPQQPEKEIRSARRFRDDGSVSYDFKWLLDSNEIEFDRELVIFVNNNMVNSFDLHYVFEEVDDQDDMIDGFIQAILMVIIAVIIIVLGYKKSRSYEIRFRLALYLGILLAAANAFELYFLTSRLEGWEMLLAIVISPLFYAGIFVIAWAVSESVGRETWGEKFIPLDLLMKGYVFNSKIGEGLLRGMAFGALAFSVLLIATWVFSRLLSISYISSDNFSQDVFASFRPAILTIGHSLWSNLYILAINVLLIMALVYQKTHKSQLTIVLAAIPMALMFGGNIYPIYFGIFINILAMGIILWSFYRFDLWTAFISLMIFSILDYGLAFTNSDDASMATSVIYLFSFFVVLVLFAAVTIYTRDKIKNYDDIESGLAKFISERQRMQQELKIARDVQMSFLPQHIPSFRGLDIAAKCIPAQDVGGDYYDFVRIDPSRLGVAIGDVSGKGTRAAFYMTLVKGFLKALSKTIISPAELLKELNILFFENAKRDAFISMAYGVFDMTKNALILALSGHNPVILYRSSENNTEFTKTEGLALGLEKGALFNKMMQETIIPIKPKDIIVFYTDGMTEAMNSKMEEYGEERVCESIKKYSGQNADLILRNLIADIEKYCRGADQHDDMSAVVVKVL